MPTPAQKTTASPSALGQGIAVKSGAAQVVQVINPKPGAAAATTTTGATRPSYGTLEVPAGAPSVLDYRKTSIVMKDLPEDQFRATIAEVLSQVDDLGLNRSFGQSGEGEARAQAYLDMVTWDTKTRAGYANDHSIGTSSCGMFIRDVWWLLGARGAKIMDEPYKSGIITLLLEFAAAAKKSWGAPSGKTFNHKTFFPKVGDVLYVYDAAKNSQHIFILTGIDKEIVDEDGVATVYEPGGGGKRASVITFTSVDGGQSDGLGKDGLGHGGINWGCQATKAKSRSMVLKDGHFPDLGTAWPFPDGTKGRPLNTWVSIYGAKDLFTAPLIKPIRVSRINTTGGASGGSSGATGAAAGGQHSDASDSQAKKRQDWDKFIEQNQGRAMSDLLHVLASAGYREVLDIRNWYASPENPKREAFGLRVQVAMDAILHRNEGPGAAWILSECELAGISAAHSSDQYSLIKSTIGMGSASGNVA